ncbi:hypothetical protein HMPREF3041_01938, partial [Escherichia coli]
PGDYESLALTSELKGRAQDNNVTKSMLQAFKNHLVKNHP